MSDNPDTIDIIVDDMLNEGHTGPADSLEWVQAKMKFYADRIKAAHEREVEDAERRGNHAATKAICDTLEKVGPLYDADSIGNAAKLREALVLALSLLDLKEGVPYKTVSQKDIDFMKAALAAPARNCDMGTPEEQSRHFCAFCRPRTEPCDECACLEGSRKGRCEFVWAQMPYAEGGAK